MPAEFLNNFRKLGALYHLVSQRSWILKPLPGGISHETDALGYRIDFVAARMSCAKHDTLQQSIRAAYWIGNDDRQHDLLFEPIWPASRIRHLIWRNNLLFQSVWSTDRIGYGSSGVLAAKSDTATNAAGSSNAVASDLAGIASAEMTSSSGAPAINSRSPEIMTHALRMRHAWWNCW